MRIAAGWPSQCGALTSQDRVSDSQESMQGLRREATGPTGQAEIGEPGGPDRGWGAPG